MADQVGRGVAPRPGILKIRPHMIDGGVTEIPRIDISSNESAMGPSPLAVAAGQAAMERVERYPDRGPERLAEAVGAAFGLDPARILCGHGSDDLLARIARAYLAPGDELIYPVHGYQKFANYAHANDAVPVAAPDRDFRADVDAILERVTARSRIVMLANPDNPTGTYVPGAEVRRLRAGLPDSVLLVLDSAYAEYVDAPDYETATALVDAHDNVVMTRTFSKIFGLAGARMGWLYGPPAVVDPLARIGVTFPLCGASLAAGLAALEDSAHCARVCAENRDTRTWFGEEAARIGLQVTPSQTNFLLVRFSDPAKPAPEADAFLRSRGILARRFPAPDFKDCIRFTIGTVDEMRVVAETLSEFLDEGGAGA